MTRRDVLQRIGLAIAAQDLVQAAPTQPVHTLPGTQPLTWDGDLAERMMDGAHKYVERIIAESVEARRKYWKRDLSSRAAYEKSVEPNRDRFRARQRVDRHRDSIAEAVKLATHGFARCSFRRLPNASP